MDSWNNKDPDKEDRKKRRNNDPFFEMFEEMQKQIDEMMNKRFEQDPFEEMRGSDKPQSFTVNFSIQSPNKSMKIQEIEAGPGNQNKQPGSTADIIDKGDKFTLILEIPGDVEEKDVKVDLSERKVRVNAPGFSKDVNLSREVEGIEKKRFKNNILEVDLSKKD